MRDNSRFFFVLTAVGAAVGIGSRFAFGYLSYQYGAWFFLSYFLALILLGIPLLSMEFSAGQYFKRNIVDTFHYIRQYLGFFGWLIIFNTFILLCIYSAKIAWHIIYMFVSFGLQWKGRASEYFLKNVLQVSGVADFTSFSLSVFIAILITWLLVYTFIKKGYDSLSRGFTALMTIGAMLLVFFLIYFLSLPNAIDGVYSIFHGSYHILFSLDLWISSFSMAAVSIGVSFGIMHVLSQKTQGFIIRSASITALFEFLTSIGFAFILFSIAGFLATKQKMTLSSLIFSEYYMTFTKLADALVYLPQATIISILFFFFLALIFFLGACTLAYSAVNLLVRKLDTKNRNVAIIVCGFGFLFSLIYVVKPGFYVIDIMNHYIYYNILIILLFETLIFGYLANSRKIAQYVNETSFLKLGNAFRIMIRYIIPLIILGIIFHQIRLDWLGYKGYPWWTIWLFGIGTILVPAVAAFLMPTRLLDKKKS